MDKKTAFEAVAGYFAAILDTYNDDELLEIVMDQNDVQPGSADEDRLRVAIAEVKGMMAAVRYVERRTPAQKKRRKQVREINQQLDCEIEEMLAKKAQSAPPAPPKPAVDTGWMAQQYPPHYPGDGLKRLLYGHWVPDTAEMQATLDELDALEASNDGDRSSYLALRRIVQAYAERWPARRLG